MTSAATTERSLPLIGRKYEPENEMDTPLIMGVDPGLNGAISVVEIDSGLIIDMIDMPKVKKASKSRKQGYIEFLDPHVVSSAIDIYAPLTALCVLEEPGAMPGQGLGSTFKFGHSCGLIHGIMAGHYIPTVPVKPGVWKGALGLTASKDESRILASDEFSGFSWLWQLKKHNDRAESALLALYGLRYLADVIKFSRK